MKTAIALVAALSVVAQAGCGVGTGAGPTPTNTPAPMMPGDVTPTGAPDHLRRDLGNGIVAAKAEYGDGRAIYVTHVPSGAQVVLGGDGDELERHDGDGMAAVEAVLAEEGMRADLGTMLDVPGPDRDNCIADYVPVLHIGGVHYIATSWPVWKGPMSPDLVGEQVYRVAFRTDCSGTGMGYQLRNGDATFLKPGTPVYTVHGYDPSFRLAVVGEQGATLYEATDNPAAKVGEDLLDIRGKVTSVEVLSEQDAETVLGTIDDARTVESIVETVLASPVHHGERDGSGERYFLGFRLNDGTSVVRAFWLESGELHRGIMTPPAVTSLVWNGLPEDQRLELTEQLAVRLGLAALNGGGRVTALSPPDFLEARQMLRSDYAALRGASLGDVPDPLVWVVEATGEWRVQGGPASGAADGAETYRYGAVAIEAETGQVSALSLRYRPLHGEDADAPSPTPTRHPTPTEIK